MNKPFMYLDDIELGIDRLIEEYEKMMKKAMDSDEVDKVNQFHGSIIALECLKPVLGINGTENETEE